MKILIKFVFFISFLALILLSAGSVYACSCLFHLKPMQAEYSETEVVFVGKVKQIEKILSEPYEGNSDFLRHRRIHFIIERAYKGIESQHHRITANTSLFEANCGFGKDSRPRKGQTWLIFANKNKDDNQLYFGGMCAFSYQIRKKSEVSEFEKDIVNNKVKQAIIVGILDEFKIVGIPNIKVEINGSNETNSILTNESGISYFPVSKEGKYKVKVYFSGEVLATRKTMRKYDIKKLREDAEQPEKITTTVVSYEVNLKSNQYDYEEMDIIFRKN